MSHSRPTLAWQRGTVTAVGAGRVRVRFGALQHCRTCLRGQGCGAGVFGRLFSRRGAELWVAAQDDFRPGQAVRVGVRERDLLRAAGLLYGLPLLAFILAAALAATFFEQALARDAGALAAGLAGAGFSLWLVGPLRPRLLNPRLESLSASPGWDGECDELESADH